MVRRARVLGRRLGYTLIEVCVATVVVAIGLVGVAGAFSYAARVSRLCRDSVVAENLAGGLLSQARFRGVDQIADWYTYPGEQDVTGLEQDFSAMLAQSGLARPEAWLTVADVQGELKGVTIAVEWGTGSPRGRVVLDTLISPRF